MTNDGRFELTGLNAPTILQRMFDEHPELVNILLKAREIRHNKAVEEYQAAVLYHLVRPYAAVGATAFEVGTARGYSASVIARGFLPGRLTTITPDATDHENARRNLSSLPNVSIVMAFSNQMLGISARFDFIFVDGDHKHVRADFPFFNHLRPGGMIVFHDYSPASSARACPPVYDGLNDLRAKLGRDFDVLVVDDQQIGLAGFVRRDGESWTE